MSEEFSLQNDPPAAKRIRINSDDRNRQLLLLSGLDCLAGQRDLFATDGEAPVAVAPPEVWLTEFRHGHFGWLERDERFTSQREARDWLRDHPSPYEQRARRIT